MILGLSRREDRSGLAAAPVLTPVQRGRRSVTVTVTVTGTMYPYDIVRDHVDYDAPHDVKDGTFELADQVIDEKGSAWYLRDARGRMYLFDAGA